MDDPLERCRRDLRRLNQRKRKQMVTTDEGTGLTLGLWRTALCIGLLCDYDMRAGAAWLEATDRRRRPLAGGVEKGDVLERMREFFREADFDSLFALQDKDLTDLKPGQYRTAVQRAREYKLGLWVREQNLVVGYAVRTPVIIEQFNHGVAAAQCHLPVYPVPSSDFVTGRTWAHRWRKRNGAKFGKLQVLEPLSVQEKRDKVGASFVGP